MADQQISTVKDQTELEHLELPKTDVRSLIRHFGPGMVLMMTGIGTSHLVTAPTAGGRFAFALLWCLPLAYIFKYYGFEMAFRFTNATGKSIMEAYGTAWKKWPLWYVLITTVIQCAVGQAGRLVACAAVLYYFFSVFLGWGLPLWSYGLVMGIICVTIILSGTYSTVETVAKIASGMLLISTVAVYFIKPAPMAAMAHFFIFEMPDGSWLIVAAFLGLLPTGMDVSLQASEWGKAKKVGMGKIRSQLEEIGLAKSFDPFTSKKEDLTADTIHIPPHALEYCQRWFKIGLWDFRFGHVISFFIACLFLLLAAVWMYPSSVSGRGVMGEIAQIFTQSVGPGAMVLFILGAFAATFSTAFNYFDGWPRVVGACCRNLFRSTASLSGVAREDLTDDHRRTWYSEYNIYRMTMLFSLITAVVLIVGVPRPVYLVLVASALAYFIAPVVFFLNYYYCVTVIPKEDTTFYPSLFARCFSWISMAIFTGMSTLLILVRIFDIQLN